VPSSRRRIKVGGGLTVAASGSDATGESGTAVAGLVSTSATVALSAYRLLSGSGTTTLSSGVPLLPGQLPGGTVGNVRLFKGGVEQACYVEVIGSGAYSDGTPYSILVQAAGGSLTNGTADTTWDVRFGTAFSVARLAKDTAAVKLVPDGMLLPTTLSSYGTWGGWMSPIGFTTSDAAQPWLTTIHGFHQTWGDTHWTNDPGSSWNNSNAGASYDRGLHWAHLFFRTGTPKWIERGLTQCADWVSSYMEGANDYGAVPWHMQIESPFTMYHLTGSSRYATCIVEWLTRKTSSAANPAGTLWTGSFAEGRPMARFWKASLAIYLLGRTEKPSWWSGTITTLVDAYAAAMDDVQGVDGGMNYPMYAPSDKFFMTGMVMEAGLTHILRRGTSTSTILAAMQPWLDYIWTFRFTGAAHGGVYFPYCDSASGDCHTGATGAELNGFYSVPFYGYAALSGNTTYRDRGDEVVRAMSANNVTGGAFYPGVKQYNEAFRRFAPALWWRTSSGTWP
jgi:hypothetical protein